MIVYNVTTKITQKIASDWLRWQQEEHSPELMATGLFSNFRIYRILDQDDSEGPTYTIQYFTDSLENYHQYISEFAPLLRKKAIDKWGDHFISFRTIMGAVN